MYLVNYCWHAAAFKYKLIGWNHIDGQKDKKQKPISFITLFHVAVSTLFVLQKKEGKFRVQTIIEKDERASVKVWAALVALAWWAMNVDH